LAIQLTLDGFRHYPPAARRLAEAHGEILQQLPIGFVSFLLKELIEFDWKFPVEQRFLLDQLAYLEHFKPDELRAEMNAFQQLHLSRELESFDWVNRPADFLDKLSAHLWATHQIDAFRAAADQYIKGVHAFRPREPLPMPRLGVVMIGQGASETRYRLFRKLRRQGTFLTRIQPVNGSATILDFAAQRASAHPHPFAHWYVDGGKLLPGGEALTCVSYHSLLPVRVQIAQRMQSAFESPAFGPEALRTALAQLKAEDLGLSGSGPDGLLNRFQVKLLTEGSGTQIFSTTFVQWAVREVYRRAEPLTLVARFAPRARSEDMSYLLANVQAEIATDPEDSLVDADMGAWYSWLNQQRLPEADRTGFLAWYEDHGEAVAIGGSFAPGTEDHNAIDMAELLRRLT
jgi:hypothetical protein